MSDTTPSRVAAILANRGMEDLGAEMQRRLQHADYLAQQVAHLREDIKELEKLLPDDVWDERQLAHAAAAAERRHSHAGGRRAPPESDG